MANILFCLLVVGALLHGSVDANSYEKAVQKLEDYLQSHVSDDSRKENVQAARQFISETLSINRANADDALDATTYETFYLFGSLPLEYFDRCQIETNKLMLKLDTILSHKVCKPTLEGGNRVERIVHRFCREWAKECIETWVYDYRRALGELPKEVVIHKHLDVFLQNSDSKKPVEPLARIEQVEKNLNGPEAGKMLAIAMLNQMLPKKRYMLLRNVDKNLAENFERYLVEPCKMLTRTTKDPTNYTMMILKALAPNELPVGNDAMIMVDGAGHEHVCRSVIKNKKEHMKNVRTALISSKQ